MLAKLCGFLYIFMKVEKDTWPVMHRNRHHKHKPGRKVPLCYQKRKYLLQFLLHSIRFNKFRICVAVSWIFSHLPSSWGSKSACAAYYLLILQCEHILCVWLLETILLYPFFQSGHSYSIFYRYCAWYNGDVINNKVLWVMAAYPLLYALIYVHEYAKNSNIIKHNTNAYNILNDN